jgi:hypothetical protein
MSTLVRSLFVVVVKFAIHVIDTTWQPSLISLCPNNNIIMQMYKWPPWVAPSVRPTDQLLPSARTL